LNDTYDYAHHDDDGDEGTAGTLPGGAQTTGESSFSSVARKEWIHAVFGKSLQQPKGKGLAQIDEYLCTRIYIESDVYQNSLGITLSRLTLGLYVRNVKPGSEAALAGVLPQSVLVSVNDIHLLAEPSKQALERIWQYEGLFASVSKYAKPYSKDAADHVMDLPRDDLMIQHPMRLTFIRNGQLYSVLLLANPPYGIEWAPCGNFALVKRNDGGHTDIPRGSIIAGVNENPIDDLDHLTSATFLKEAMDLELPIDMLVCWPPATARSGYWERTEIAKRNSASPQMTKSKGYKPIFSKEHDGVKTTVHSLFSKIKKKPTPEVPKNDWGLELDDLAAAVGSGEVLMADSTPEKANSVLTRVYLPCSNLDGRLLEAWNVEQSLLYNLKYYWTMNMVGDNVGDFVGHRSLSDLFLDFPKPLFQDVLWPLIACCRHTSPGTPTAQEALHKMLFDEIISLAETKPAFAPSMELIATSLQELELRNILTRIRQKRAASSPIVKNNSNFTFDGVDKNKGGSSKDEGGATTATSPEQAITPTKKRFGLFGKKSKPKSPSAKTTSPKKSKSPKRNKKAQQQTPSDAASPGNSLSLMLDEQDKQEQDRQIIGAREIMFAKTLKFGDELLEICQDIERSLQKTFPQRLAESLQPWSSSKETALLQVTNSMRDRLELCTNTEFLNPLDSDELIVGVDAAECYILPSAHFPVLLTFDCQDLKNRESPNNVFGVQKFYRTTVEILHVQCAGRAAVRRNFVVHASVGGAIQETNPSTHTDVETNTQMWDDGAALVFDTSSSWGPPQTISLRLSESFVTNTGVSGGKETQDSNSQRYLEDVGVSWADLTSVVDSKAGGRIQKRTVVVKPKLLPSKISGCFDEHGELSVETAPLVENVEIKIRVTTQTLEMNPLIKKSEYTDGPLRKRSLLYKRDDDVRQDLFSIEFIKNCDAILKSCGLDLKLVTFRCIPMGDKQGFIEWVHGSVPLSELSRAFSDSIFGDSTKSPTSTAGDATSGEQNEKSMMALAGLSKYETLQRWNSDVTGTNASGNAPNNPVQDYLRTFNYDADAPYMIRKEAMDTYVKSCAGYCAITYILGVGDRHLDNLLLHQTGHFFHCDFSFILGNDPKKYLPVRITEEMVNGMGGKDSDGFLMFLSLTCAAFLTLRRPENVRHLLSMIRMMEGCYLPDVEKNQDIEAAIMGVRNRLRLDLSDDEAISFMEKLIEESASSKMWLAVDAMHTLGKRF